MQKKDIGGRSPYGIAVKNDMKWLIMYLKKRKSIAVMHSVIRFQKIAQRRSILKQN